MTLNNGRVVRMQTGKYTIAGGSIQNVDVPHVIKVNGQWVRATNVRSVTGSEWNDYFRARYGVENVEWMPQLPNPGNPDFIGPLQPPQPPLPTMVLGNGRVVRMQTGNYTVTSGNIQNANVVHMRNVNGQHVRIPPIGSNVANHLTNVEDINRKGVVGGHNRAVFEREISNMHPDVWLSDVIIEEIPHPTIAGITQIRYQLPLKLRGSIIAEPIQFRPIVQPKTIFNPSIISDQQMMICGREAMQNGIIIGDTIHGMASNGLKFVGYIRDGVITNFYPVLR